MMSIFAREMISKGRQEGRQEGHREEAIKILLRLLSRRFGVLPIWTQDRVHGADIETLEAWSDQVLDARSLEEMFGANPVH